TTPRFSQSNALPPDPSRRGARIRRLGARFAPARGARSGEAREGATAGGGRAHIRNAGRRPFRNPEFLRCPRRDSSRRLGTTLLRSFERQARAPRAADSRGLAFASPLRGGGSEKRYHLHADRRRRPRKYAHLFTHCDGSLGLPLAVAAAELAHDVAH